MSRGGCDQVVSVIAIQSNEPSSNPAEVYNFSVKLLLKRTKKAGVGPFKARHLNKCHFGKCQ